MIERNLIRLVKLPLLAPHPRYLECYVEISEKNVNLEQVFVALDSFNGRVFRLSMSPSRLQVPSTAAKMLKLLARAVTSLPTHARLDE